MEVELAPDDVALVGGLVAIPSVSRGEADAVEWLVERMRERGFRSSVDAVGNAVGEIGEGRSNLRWVLDRTMTAICAITAGACQEALRITAEYTTLLTNESLRLIVRFISPRPRCYSPVERRDTPCKEIVS